MKPHTVNSRSICLAIPPIVLAYLNICDDLCPVRRSSAHGDCRSDGCMGGNEEPHYSALVAYMNVHRDVQCWRRCQLSGSRRSATRRLRTPPPPGMPRPPPFAPPACERPTPAVGSTTAAAFASRSVRGAHQPAAARRRARASTARRPTPATAGRRSWRLTRGGR